VLKSIFPDNIYFTLVFIYNYLAGYGIACYNRNRQAGEIPKTRERVGVTIKLKKMKTLEKFSELKIAAEEQETVNGGAPLHTSGFAPNGSKWTFDGDLNLTEQLTGAGTTHHYTNDWCGTAIVDGNIRSDCWQQIVF